MRAIPRHGILILAMQPEDMREIYEMLPTLSRKRSNCLLRAIRAKHDASQAGGLHHGAEGVLNAVLTGDAKRAGALYRAHRERVQKDILGIIERHNLRRR